MARATEKSLENLHNLVTKDLINRIKSEEHSTADIRAAIEWLKANSITGVPVDNSPLRGLSELINEIEFDEVEVGVL